MLPAEKFLSGSGTRCNARHQISCAVHAHEQMGPPPSALLLHRSGVVPWEQGGTNKIQRSGTAATEAESSTGIRRKLGLEVPEDALLETGAPVGQHELMSPQICSLSRVPGKGHCAETLWQRMRDALLHLLFRNEEEWDKDMKGRRSLNCCNHET